MSILNNNYFLITLFLCILVIYLILPVPRIIFRLHNDKVVNVQETSCKN